MAESSESTAKAPSEPTTPPRALVSLVCALVLVEAVFATALMPLLPHYVGTAGLTKAGAGFLVAVYPLGTFIGALSRRLLTSRLGYRLVVLLASALTSGATLVFGWTTTPAMLDAARFVHGLAAVFMWAAGTAWLTAAAPKYRGYPLSLYPLLAATLGGLLGPVIGVVANQVGTGPTFAGVAVAGACLTVVALLVPGPRAILVSGAGAIVPHRPRVDWQAVRDPVARTGTWLIILPGLALGVIEVLAPLGLAALGGSVVVIGGAFVAAVVIQVVLSWLVRPRSLGRGALLPTQFSLAAAVVVSLLASLFAAIWSLVAAVIVVSAACMTLSEPASRLRIAAEQRLRTNQRIVYGFPIAMSAGQIVGAVGSGALAQATSALFPFTLLAGAFLVTLVMLNFLVRSVGPTGKALHMGQLASNEQPSAIEEPHPLMDEQHEIHRDNGPSSPHIDKDPIVESGESVGRGVGMTPGEPQGPGGASQPPGPEPDRYLVGELPSRVRVGKELSLIVSIVTKSPETGLAAVPLPSLFPGPRGVQVTLVVRPDSGLLAIGELQQTVTVSQRGDPPPVRFAFRCRAVGLSRVRITSWLGGTFLAELRLEVSVESEEPTADSQRHSTQVGALRADPGEVTLQVHSDGRRYSFQLHSQRYLFGPVLAKSLTEEPGQAVERTVAMLRRMAAGASGYTPELAARWVRETGTGLWQDLVPRLIQDQFWQLRDSITSFNIACEDDTVPWELLYPLTPADDGGFLIEQFPVLRRVYDQCRSDHVLLGNAHFVVPPGSPDDAQDEVAVVSRILGQPAGSVITDLADLLRLLDAGGTGLLHFACHNTFSLEAGGSAIKMVGGTFVPQLLNSAVGRRCLADCSPLIFINACRSAGVSAEFTKMTGWASQFMAAGAGAFIGTMWPVRSSQANLFAEAFYSTLAAGTDLGQAILAARKAAKDDADPTWLAYTAYGDPTAQAAAQL